MSGKHYFPTKGIECWKNNKNGFFVFQIHYSADPKKTPEYMGHIRDNMPIGKYNQEYEIVWDSFSGLPVYRDYNEEINGSKDSISAEFGLPLLRGWDFGLTPSVVVCQLQESCLKVLWEKTALNMGIEKFADQALSEMRIRFPEWSDQKKDWRDFIDPAGNFRKDTDESTCAQKLVERGLRPIPGEVGWEKRRSSVEHFLVSRTKDSPNFLLDVSNCPMLARGFRGGYRYPDKAAEIEPTKLRPLKDEHSHPHDALQYVCSKIVQQKDKKKGRKIPRPNYKVGNWDATLPKIPSIMGI